MSIGNHRAGVLLGIDFTPIDLQPAYPGAPFTRRWAADQALISSRIEGFRPDPEYLALREEVIMGRLTPDEAVARIIAEAQAEDAKLRAT